MTPVEPRKWLAVAALVTATSMITAASAQTYRMTTPVAPGVATPDTLETSIGTLNLKGGFPEPAAFGCGNHYCRSRDG